MSDQKTDAIVKDRPPVLPALEQAGPDAEHDTAPRPVAHAAATLAAPEAGAPSRARASADLQQSIGNARMNQMLDQDTASPDTTSTQSRRIQRKRAGATPKKARGGAGKAKSTLRPFVAEQVATVRDAVEVRGDFDTIPPRLQPDEVGPQAPGGAFYYLNGLNPADLIDTLQALGPGIRGKLLANIGLADGKFDRPRLEAALRSTSWGEGKTGKVTVSLLDAIRNAGAGPFTDIFKQFEGLPRIEVMARLRALDAAALNQLGARVSDAAPTQQARMGQILGDLLATPMSAASDVIDVEKLRGLDRQMARIYNIYGQYLESQARDLGIDTAAAAGIMQVESGGKTFDPGTDKPLIRFETHVLWDQWGKHNATLFDQHFTFDRSKGGKRWTGHAYREDSAGAWQSYHGSQAREWAAVEFAATLAGRESTYRSMSVGAGQIMGFNYALEGYGSAEAMVESFSASERRQLGSIFDFIRNVPGLLEAVQKKDYEKLAAKYNGPGQKAFYAGKIRSYAAAYERVTRGKRHVIP